ncbi:hypothetical protein Nepgr_025344 [Nepenthes gracilis]|uniref:Secreted protein n=1 Tax=Nepenthes gracilis TaxID=150966 RepID=A0AAD3T6I0_NEPGR|nr:hypothetical protein Nepgr_025344 [Nepenthes gracilis]
MWMGPLLLDLAPFLAAFESADCMGYVDLRYLWLSDHYEGMHWRDVKLISAADRSEYASFCVEFFEAFICRHLCSVELLTVQRCCGGYKCSKTNFIGLEEMKAGFFEGGWHWYLLAYCWRLDDAAWNSKMLLLLWGCRSFPLQSCPGPTDVGAMSCTFRIWNGGISVALGTLQACYLSPRDELSQLISLECCPAFSPSLKP